MKALARRCRCRRLGPAVPRSRAKTCASAIIERVVHHADVVKIEGKSYRLRESELADDQRRASRRAKNQPEA